MDEQRERTRRIALLYGKDRGLGVPTKTVRVKSRRLYVMDMWGEVCYYSHTVGETDVYTSE